MYKVKVVSLMKSVKKRKSLAMVILSLSIILGIATPIQAARSFKKASNRAEAIEELGTSISDTLSTTRNLMKEFQKKHERAELSIDRNSITENSRNNYWYADGKKYILKKISRKAYLAQKNTSHYFYQGHCTHYINFIYHIPWHGNAKYWVDRAREMGYKTSDKPEIGDIAVTTESRFGHVSFVEEVNEANGTFTVSEMNFGGYGQMTKREIPLDYSKIIGFIKGDQLEKQTEALDTIRTQLANVEDLEELKEEALSIN